MGEFTVYATIVTVIVNRLEQNSISIRNQVENRLRIK